MLPPVKPALDPFAQRAAIDALEAQRSAYQRYARTVDDQTRAVGNGNADSAVTAASTAARGFGELDAGAQALRPHLDRVREQGSPDQQADVQHRLATLSSDADRAQTAIQNLTSQLDAWRLAYGRQLAAVGLTPGSSGSTTATATTNGAASGGAAGSASNAAEGVASRARPAEPGTPTSGAGEPRSHDSRGYGPRGQAGSGRPAPTLLNRLG